MKIKINARKKMQRTVDSTGKRLTAEEMEAEKANAFVGAANVEIWDGETAILKFRATVIAGKTERFVGLPGKYRSSTWEPAFHLGNDLKKAVNKGVLQAMHRSENIGRAADLEIEA